MSMDRIWLVSVLEDKPYKEVREIWRMLKRKYNCSRVWSFPHSHIAFQGAKTDDIRQLKRDFRGMVSKIKPFQIEVKSVIRFDGKVICLRLEKTDALTKLKCLLNRFLKDNCQSLLGYFTPEKWVPHVTLAMDDLSKSDFRRAWVEIKQKRIAFGQTIHNICLVKSDSDGKARIAKKYDLI